jgi:hypothetical protein
MNSLPIIIRTVGPQLAGSFRALLWVVKAELVELAHCCSFEHFGRFGWSNRYRAIGVP